MPTPVIVGDRVEEIDLVGLFESDEGSIAQLYGRIGQGKTTNGTQMVLEDLSRGEVVYANWRIDYDGFDQRLSLIHLFSSICFPWRRRFYRFPKENLHYITIDEFFLDRFSHLTDCKVYLDEGHVAFDSYEQTRMSLEKRMAVLHTRHFNRSIVVLSQRPSAIHVTMRANVNLFYKCEKVLTWPFLLFKRTTYEDLDSRDLPDETRPSGFPKLFIGTRSLMTAFNSKYLRNGMERSQKVYVEGYELTYSQRLYTLLTAVSRVVRDRLPALPVPARHAPAVRPRGPIAKRALKDILPKKPKI